MLNDYDFLENLNQIFFNDWQFIFVKFYASPHILSKHTQIFHLQNIKIA